MPRADIAALQLARLKQTLAHAYAKVPHVRAKFDAAKVKPDDCKSLADIVRFPFATKADLRDTYPFGLFAVPREQITPAARLLRHHRQGHRGRLHQSRPRPVDRPDGALHGLRRRAAGRHRAQRLRLRPVHRRARRALRRRAARLHRGAGVGRHDRAAGDAAAGLRRARALRHAVLRAQHRRGRGGHGRRHPQAAAAHRHFRRRAVERRDAPRPRGAARASGGRSLRAVRDHRAGRRRANATWRATACTAGRIISCSR